MPRHYILTSVPVERELARHVEARVLDGVDAGVAHVLLPDGHPLALDVGQRRLNRLAAAAAAVGAAALGPGWQFDRKKFGGSFGLKTNFFGLRFPTIWGGSSFARF